MQVKTWVLIGCIGLAGCVSIPRAPNVTVYKAPHRTFEEYQHDASYCRDYASQQVGVAQEGSPAVETGITTAAVAGLLGAGLGAAIGAVSGSPGAGAAIGGAAGVATGAVAGVHRGDQGAMTLQQRFDSNYAICMDAYGHRVSGAYVLR